METNAKNLRLKAKMKLISMSCGNQSSQQPLAVSDSHNHKPLTTLSDDEKVNKILVKDSIEQICSGELRANVLKLISSSMPSGIPLSSLVDEYNTIYDRSSPLDVSNIKDLISLMLSTQQIYSNTIDGISRVFINTEKNVILMNSFVENLFCDNIIDGVVCPGDRMKDMSIPLNATSEINNTIDVKVTFIDDPLNIWIQIKKDKSDTVLQTLSEDLQFYNRVDLEKWRVPQQFLCIGLPVITCHLSGDKCWQRARVTEIHAFTVTVCFVDFGGMATPSFDNIYLMKRHFLTPPVQALRVGLFGVNHLTEKNFRSSVMLTDNLRCILLAKNYIRCDFIEKISDDYYYVHLFDRKNLFLDSDLFVNDFLRDKNECSHQTRDLLNDKHNKSIENHSAIRSTISGNMNLLDLRLEAKKKLISMCSEQSSEQSTTVSDCNDHKPLTTLSDDEKVNKILVKKSNANKICSAELRANVLKLISSSMPFGISLSSLIDEYNTNYDSSSPLDVSYIKDLISLMLSKGQIYSLAIDGINRVFINSEKDLSNINGFVENLFGYNFDIVCPGDRLRDIPIQFDVTFGINNLTDVRVTFIKDPLNIWIQLNNNFCRTVLQMLLQDLQFYNSVDLEKWRVPQHFLCIGLPVIVFCAGNKCWQRARVTEIHACTVTVCFVDYGGTATPSIHNVYLMKRQFLTQPAQALRVGLFPVNHLIEKNFRWPVMLIYKLRCILLINSCIRCNFIQKFSDDYHFVQLFDHQNLHLALYEFFYDFFRNEIEYQTRDVLNDKNYKSIKNNNDNHAAIRSTNSVNMNLLDLSQQSSVASISEDSVNHDQLLSESVQYDDHNQLNAPLIPEMIHSFYGSSKNSTETYKSMTNKVNNTESSFSSTSGIRSLKPNIKITFNIDIARKTVSSINNY